MNYNEILKSVEMKDVKEYAKALLDCEEECWECDPVLIEEYWSDKVHEFLEFLAK